MTAVATNTASFARLFWKEYRTVRWFWIALVALVVLIQLITLTFSQDSRDSMLMIYNFALGAPAFFAVGCAGAAFAMEREEGTYEFLRASPVTSKQVFTSKLAVAFGATLAMFSLLLPIAVWFMHGQLPDVPIFSSMLGLWLVAAMEAIAWGTLFSLLTARPLLAIFMAIAATSTIAHALAWTRMVGPLADFSYSPYLQVAPWRLIIVGLVFAADLYLGLQWLNESDEYRPKRKVAVRYSRKKPRNTAASIDNALSASLATKPDRSAMFGHLFWQNWRQSWRLMAVMGALTFVAILISQMLNPVFRDHRLTAIPILVLAAITGCCVYLADQEKHGFRFFLEHNVPPRYVWFTRLIPWSLVAFVATVYFCWQQFAQEFWPFIANEIHLSTNVVMYRAYGNQWRQFIYLPPVEMVLGGATAAYAAGQWASMFMRSGLMAAFVGLVMTGLLFGWVFLMDTMKVSFWWSVWPIPVVLLFATWLRAPDWIRENTRWNARLRAAAVVLIPTAILLIAVPYYRVHQIPLVDPGFDVDAYLAEITPDGLKAGELHRRAHDSYAIDSPSYSDTSGPGFLHRKRAFNKEDAAWIKSNSEMLDLILKAVEQPDCVRENPQTISDSTSPSKAHLLMELIIASGRELEAAGKLDAAMERYFVGLKVVSQWNSYGMPATALLNASFPREVLSELRQWSTSPGQTSEQIAAAIKRLEDLGVDYLRLSDGIKSLYIVARRYLQGDERAAFVFYTGAGLQKSQHFSGSILWATMMPWENDRAIRMLNLLTATALGRLDRMQEILATDDGTGVNDVLHLRSVLDYFEVGTVEKAEWLATTNPNMAFVGHWGIEAANQLAKFEADRRATIILLALQAYRLDHGTLPQTLSELVGPYLAKLPRDPNSGKDFLYLPHGLPEPTGEMDAEAYRSRGILPGQPGIWSIGRNLTISTWAKPEVKNEETGEISAGVEGFYYSYRLPGREGQRLPYSEVWSNGLWFPLPVPRD